MTEIIDWNALHLMTPRTVDDAVMIKDIFLNCIEMISTHIEHENDLLNSGAIEDVLVLFEAKQMKSVDYARSTDLVRRNLVAMTRLIPDAMPDLKDRQIALMSKLNENSRLLSMLRSLSENLLRGVAEEIGAKTSLLTYGENGRAVKPAPRAPSHAIIVSTSL